MKRTQLIALAGTLLAMSGLVVHSSSAAFTATTQNTGNTWSAGSVKISDNDAGSALFTETGLVPGKTGSRCIVVTYDGTVASAVRLYASTGGTGLGAYLNLSVARGGGSAADCSDFTSTETAFTGTLAGLASANATYATGVGSWAPATAGVSSTYRFTWTLQDDDAAQGKDVSATFTWEAQNT